MTNLEACKKLDGFPNLETKIVKINYDSQIISQQYMTLSYAAA